MGDVEAVEVLAQDVVHPRGHVLDPTARHDDHPGIGMRGDQRRDLREAVQRPRQTHHHQARTRHRVGREGHRREAGDAESPALAINALPGQEVLVDADFAVAADDIDRLSVSAPYASSMTTVPSGSARPRRAAPQPRRR